MAGGPVLCRDIRSASRNVRARGRRAAVSVGLLAVALAANAVLFSVADSAVFYRVPYADAHRLVEIQRQTPTGPGSSFVSAALFDEWRQQTDLFAGVEGYLSKNLFLSGTGEPELVATADVTVGLLELLNARPAWGRAFIPGDERLLAEQPVLIAESLARERFGSPGAAVGQRLETSGEPLIVIGVMAVDFRFPENVHRIWRALDPRGPLARGFAGVSSIARLAPGTSRELVAEMMAQRSAAIGASAGARAPYLAAPGDLRAVTVGDEQRRMFLLLLGAAMVLLMIACANVASLELATAVDRARVYAIQLALGASRAGLARVALMEGALLLGLAMAGGILLARLALTALTTQLPGRLTRGGVNPVDFDERTFGFMAAAAASAWLLSSLPTVVFASRGNLLDLLKLEGHAVAASKRSGWVRRALTAGEIALAVVLLVAAVGYVRSYQALLAQNKGFDSSGVVTVSLTIPPQAYATPGARVQLRQRVLEVLREHPGVLTATAASAPPFMGAAYGVDRMEIDDRGPVEEPDLRIAELDIEPEYFAVLRIPLLAGRMLRAGDGRTDMVVSETFADRYWPGQQAAGRSYRRAPNGPWYRVVGVVGHVRSPYDPPGGRSPRNLQTYVLRQPPPPPKPVAPGPPPMATGGNYGFLNLMARVDARERVGGLYEAIRAIDSGFILELNFVDDVYARNYEDRLLATRVVGAFGVLAFLVAAAGIYGVMTFLVVQRTREIGVRVALGATRRDITKLVVGSSMKIGGAGAVIGVGGAWLTARLVQTQLYGVDALDPLAIAGVGCAVLLVAALATWKPTRRATRVDPSVLLRTE